MSISLEEIKGRSRNPEKATAKKATAGVIDSFLKYEFGSGKIKDSFKESFYSELALLLHAGMNLKSALEMLLAQQSNKRIADIIRQLTTDLVRGKRFSDALMDSGKFSPYEYYSIQIGEETGNLIEIFNRLASFYARKIKQKRNLIGSLTYPIVILFTAILAVTFMLTFMVPMFEDVFKRMGNELPFLTELVISLSENFSGFLLVTILVILVLAGFNFYLRNNISYKRYKAHFAISIPLIGPVLLKNHMLRLMQSLSLLLNSRVPLTEAMELTSRMVRFHLLQEALRDAKQKVLSGSALYESLNGNKIFDNRLKGLVKVGEETNSLGPILEKLADQTEIELEHKAKMMGNILEPLIIVFLGALVAVVLISMYLPIFQLSSGF